MTAEQAPSPPNGAAISPIRYYPSEVTFQGPTIGTDHVDDAPIVIDNGKTISMSMPMSKVQCFLNLDAKGKCRHSWCLLCTVRKDGLDCISASAAARSIEPAVASFVVSTDFIVVIGGSLAYLSETFRALWWIAVVAVVAVVALVTMWLLWSQCGRVAIAALISDVFALDECSFSFDRIIAIACWIRSCRSKKATTGLWQCARTLQASQGHSHIHNCRERHIHRTRSSQHQQITVWRQYRFKLGCHGRNSRLYVLETRLHQRSHRESRSDYWGTR